jgi:uncharacterized membrane protein YfcA
MEKRLGLKYITAGLLAGCVNGLLGAGGGLILVPMFSGLCGMEDKHALATSVAVILPLSIVSAFFYLKEGIGLSVTPYLLGGVIGGFIAGRVFSAIPAVILRRLFGIMILYSSYRMLFK